jgi:hypothetical protein
MYLMFPLHDMMFPLHAAVALVAVYLPEDDSMMASHLSCLEKD